jgi:TPR repeat protein
MLGLNQPNVDVLRERAFSGLASYAEPEEHGSGLRRIFMMLVLLALLGAAGWWTYTSYLGAAEGRKPAAEPAIPAARTAKSAAVESAPAENLPARAHANQETKPPVVTPAAPETRAEVEPEAQNPPKPAAPVPTAARHEVSAERVPAPKATPAPAADSGEALFRRGESYLYGRGGTEDCGSALKYLKMASDKSHAKARSTMGTMYATGHCVPRDLPSSYRWFALALRADPNNAILEKDLSAVWNQMTPPERQLATKSQ